MRTVMYLVRHGTTFENEKRIFQGASDTQLTPHGMEQVKRLGVFFRELHLDAAFSSPLARARKTMQGVLAWHPELTPVICEDLKEINGGILQGMTHDEINEQYDNIMVTFREDPSRFDPPGGESIPAAYRRFCAQLLKLFDENKGKAFVVVSHRTVIQTWLSYMKGLPEDRVAFETMPNGSVSKFCMEDDGTIITEYTGKVPEEETGGA